MSQRARNAPILGFMGHMIVGESTGCFYLTSRPSREGEESLDPKDLPFPSPMALSGAHPRLAFARHSFVTSLPSSPFAFRAKEFKNRLLAPILGKTFYNIST